MITSLHFKLGTTRLYFFFLNNIPVFVDNLLWNVVCIFVFQVFFCTNENFPILGINKNTSPKNIRTRRRIYTSLTVWVCFFLQKWNCAILGIDKNTSPKIIHPRTKKYTSLTVLVKSRKGAKKLLDKKKIGQPCFWAELGINTLIQLKEWSLLHIKIDSPSTFDKKTIWFNKRYTLKIYPEQKTCCRNDIDFI